MRIHLLHRDEIIGEDIDAQYNKKYIYTHTHKEARRDIDENSKKNASRPVSTTSTSRNIARIHAHISPVRVLLLMVLLAVEIAL